MPPCTCLINRIWQQSDITVYSLETWWPSSPALLSSSPLERSRWKWWRTFRGSCSVFAGMCQTFQRCTSRWSQTVFLKESAPASPWFCGNIAGIPGKHIMIQNHILTDKKLTEVHFDTKHILFSFKNDPLPGLGEWQLWFSQ